MTHCINPDCQNSHNPYHAEFCDSCGQQLLLKNRYRAIECLGRGKFGQTFLAVDEDKPSKPRCVIKQQFDPALGGGNRANANAKSSFSLLFAQAAEKLDELGRHPHIPQLLACFEQDGDRYLIQEYIGGETLASELAEKGVFDENKIRQLLKDILPILQFIHDRQLIHRDIKPENLIRRESDGRIVLVDFGSIEVPTGLTALKAGDRPYGSAEYAAPEQTHGKAVYGSDLYSLGATCLHLMTGLSPFDLFEIEAEEWVWPDYLQQGVSHHLGRILDQLVERNPKQRYQTAGEVLQALDRPNLGSFVPPQKTRVATAVGGAAIALVSLFFSHGLPGPVVQPALKMEPRTLEAPELTYKLPTAIPDYVPSFPQDTQPMRTLAIASGPVWSVAVSPDGKTIASGSTDGTIHLWKVGADNVRVPTRILGGHFDPVWSLAISPDGQFLASGSADKTIKIWDLKTGELLDTLKGHGAGVFSLSFSPEGDFLASGSFDKSVKVWRVRSSAYGHAASRLERTFVGHSQEVQSVTFSPDGQLLASGSSDGTIKLWKWRTGKLMRTLVGHADAVWSVAISPDGQTLASGSWDKTIELWDIDSGLRLNTLKGHNEQVHSVAFSPNGKSLASGDLGGTIKLWSLPGGEEIGTLKGHSDWVEVAFVGRGNTLISGSFDDTIKMWRLSP
jgi:serine/threonine protein kinase